MFRKSLMAASLALLLAGPATADDDKQRGNYVPERRGSNGIGMTITIVAAATTGATTTATTGVATTDTTMTATTGGADDDEWRNDGWRHRWHDNRHWRHFPPSHYQLDFGYRSGYELAWRDWLSHGRYNRYWRRNSFHGYGVGHTYRSGYEAGWRDAALYYGRGYRPDYWAYDPRDGWFFGFRVEG